MLSYTAHILFFRVLSNTLICHSGSLEKYYEPANSYSRKQNFCHSEYCEMSQNFCHSGSLEKYYKLANSYFSCYSESVSTDEKPIKLDRFRISGTRIKQIPASPYILCSCLSGMTFLRYFTVRNAST